MTRRLVLSDYPVEVIDVAHQSLLSPCVWDDDDGRLSNMTHAMTANAARSGPTPASAYSALGAASGEPRSDDARAGAAKVEAETAHLAAETERLAALKGALWASFQAAPMSPVRAPIVDLTMAYTDALRLELKLRASAREERAAAAKALSKTSIRSL